MPSKNLFTALCLAPVLALALPAAAVAKSPWDGTWLLNLAKSRFVPAELAPKSQKVVRQTLDDGTMNAEVDTVDSTGAAIHTSISWKFDGKAVPVTGATDANTTRKYRRINARSYEFVTYVNGKATTTNRTVISADGNRAIATVTGVNSQGKKIHNYTVSDRQ